MHILEEYENWIFIATLRTRSCKKKKRKKEKEESIAKSIPDHLFFHSQENKIWLVKLKLHLRQNTYA